jgi:SAM-dependent methyltransferase
MITRRARLLRFVAPSRLRYWLEVACRASGTGVRECPICGYHGKFKAFGHPPRYNAECPDCRCLERHRLFYLAVQRLQLLSARQSVLHFAPEEVIGQIVRQYDVSYLTADIMAGRASLVLDIQRIALPDRALDLVIVNHVLEHVDDVAALSELYRILKPGGRVIASVPIVEGWDETYENPGVADEIGRDTHFGQSDHVRYYGRDFRNRITSAGFALQEFTVGGAESVRYSLLRGERIFIGTKPDLTKPTG